MNPIVDPYRDPKLGMAMGIPEPKRPGIGASVKNLFGKIRGITEIFTSKLPNLGGVSRDEDQALITKTSPTIWEYEMFRLEWDRRTILREIELMLRSDTRIKRANHVFASTAVRRGVTITTTSETSEALAEKAQEVVNQVVRDCQLNAKLISWARILLKEGDLFLNPVVDLKTKKLVNIKRLPGLTMQRNDDMTGNFPDTSKAFRQIDPISLQILAEFPLWAVNHIRWDHEEGDRYGNSQYLACRAYWKKLNMTEEDLVVRRRTRAPLRRLHSVGNKDNPADWKEIEKYKQINKLDPKKAQVTTDYYGNGLVDVKTLEGDSKVDQIKDVTHLQEVYMLGTGVPLHILGFGQNVNRDIVDAQMSQFEEDVQELRGLLENGDSSPYSGLRFIFDFALALAGIDATLVEYNVRWFENDNETANDRVDRVIKLRSAQPDPLITRKTALTIISKDVGLEGEDAIESELDAVKEEVAEDRKEQEALKAALNPENPSTAPISRATVSASGKPTTDATEAHKNAVFPLRSKKVEKWEKQLADEVRKVFKAVHEAIEPDLEKLIEKVEALRGVYGDAAIAKAPPKGAIEHIMDRFDDSWSVEEENLSNSFLEFYMSASGFARSNVAKELKIRITTDFINPDMQHYLQKQAADRVTGINETTKDLLRRELNQAYTNQESVPEWKARIERILDCEVPKGRAEMIARTELAWGYSRNLLATYNEVGVSRVQWLSVLDNRTCPECRRLHGEIMTLSEAEEMHPRHPRCRCTLVSSD